MVLWRLPVNFFPVAGRFCKFFTRVGDFPTLCRRLHVNRLTGIPPLASKWFKILAEGFDGEGKDMSVGVGSATDPR